MRKVTIIFIMLALVLSLSVPAFAADQTRETIVTLTFDVAVPKYTVTIPGEIELKLNEGSLLPVTVENAAYLEGRKIVITLEDATTGTAKYLGFDWKGPSYSGNYDDLLVVENSNATGEQYKTLAYEFQPMLGGSTPTNFLDKGKSLMSFTEDGTKDLVFNFVYVSDLVGDEYVSRLNPALILQNSTYKGLIVFGVKW